MENYTPRDRIIKVLHILYNMNEAIKIFVRSKKNLKQFLKVRRTKYDSIFIAKLFFTIWFLLCRCAKAV